MPQKACERCILHVGPYARKIWNAPNSNTSSFSIFLFEIWSRGFYMLEKFEMPHFRTQWLANGAYQIFRTYKNHVTRFRTETGSVRIWGISKKYAYGLTWKIHHSHAFWSISYYPAYSFFLKDESLYYFIWRDINEISTRYQMRFL